jgi:hypothetical protein
MKKIPGFLSSVLLLILMGAVQWRKWKNDHDHEDY